jgi:hypothetical protein
MDLQKEFDSFDFGNFSDVVFSADFFFKKSLDPAIDVVKNIKDFNFFIYTISKLISNKKKIHIQVPKHFDNNHRMFLIDEVEILGSIRRRDISRQVLLYNDSGLDGIASKIIKRTLPVIGINVVLSNIAKAGRLFNISIGQKSESKYNGLKPNNVAIIIDRNFSQIKGEELFLSGYNIVNFFKLKNIKSQSKSDMVAQNISISTVKSQEDSLSGKENEAKLKKALDLYSELKSKSTEFLKNAMKYKKKSDEAKKMTDNIGKQNINSGFSKNDIRDAINQCKIDGESYNSMSREFLVLHDDINVQIQDVKIEIENLRKSSI